MTHGSQRYLLLDGANIDELPRQLYTLEDDPCVEWLYHSTRYNDLFDIGPALIRLDPNTALERYFLEHWQHDAGLMIDSDAPMQTLAQHLRSLIHIRTTGDVTLLFRYYDPRVLRHWLPAQSPEERDRMMGPVSRLRLPATANQQERWIVREEDGQPVQTYDLRPWLYLDAQPLNGAHLEQFDEQLLAHVRKYFPDTLAELSHAAQLDWASACRESAFAWGLSTPVEVGRWSTLVANLGTAFPEGADHQAYRQILQQKTLSPEQRMDALLEALHRHLITDTESF